MIFFYFLIWSLIFFVLHNWTFKTQINSQLVPFKKKREGEIKKLMTKVKNMGKIDNKF